MFIRCSKYWGSKCESLVCSKCEVFFLKNFLVLSICRPLYIFFAFFCNIDMWYMYMKLVWFLSVLWCSIFFAAKKPFWFVKPGTFNEAPNTRMLVAAQAPDTAVVFVAHRVRARLEADFADLSDLVQEIDIFKYLLIQTWRRCQIFSQYSDIINFKIAFKHTTNWGRLESLLQEILSTIDFQGTEALDWSFFFKFLLGACVVL